MGIVEVGAISGRFQPFHNEHLEYACEATRRCRKLIIGITQPEVADLVECSQCPHRSASSDNPFTFAERVEMAQMALAASGIDMSRVECCRFPIDTPEELVREIPTSVTCFVTKVEAWSERKIEVLRGLGYPVEVLWTRKKRFSGESIRASIRSGGLEWHGMVPPAVVSIIERGDVSARLKK